MTHYENMPMQYTAIFRGCKNDDFQTKKNDIFLIFAQYIDCGYMLEPPQIILIQAGALDWPTISLLNI